MPLLFGAKEETHTHKHKAEQIKAAGGWRVPGSQTNVPNLHIQHTTVILLINSEYQFSWFLYSFLFSSIFCFVARLFPPFNFTALLLRVLSRCIFFIYILLLFFLHFFFLFFAAIFQWSAHFIRFLNVLQSFPYFFFFLVFAALIPLVGTFNAKLHCCTVRTKMWCAYILVSSCLYVSFKVNDKMQFSNSKIVLLLSFLILCALQSISFRCSVFYAFHPIDPIFCSQPPPPIMLSKLRQTFTNELKNHSKRTKKRTHTYKERDRATKCAYFQAIWLMYPGHWTKSIWANVQR